MVIAHRDLAGYAVFVYCDEFKGTVTERHRQKAVVHVAESVRFTAVCRIIDLTALFRFRMKHLGSVKISAVGIHLRGEGRRNIHLINRFGVRTLDPVLIDKHRRYLKLSCFQKDR